MRQKARLAVYTFAHFAVDFTCFCLLFGAAVPRLTPENAAAAVLLYDVIAFGLQPFLGYLCDARRTVSPALVGCALVLAGFCMRGSDLSIGVAALGNAAFHVGGGIDSLTNAGGKMARSGVFVSSGALGVALGTLFARSGAFAPALPNLLMFASVIAVALVCGALSEPTAAAGFPHPGEKRVTAVLLLCLASIFVRSYVGFIVPMDWKTGVFLTVLPAACAVLGKASGGFLADALGARRAGVGSLLISLPLLAFGSASPALCCLGLLFFNMTMAVTLCGLVSALPQYPGFCFGLSAFGLLCGYLPRAFFALPRAAVSAVSAAFILLSALCIWFAFPDKSKIKE